MPVDTGGVVSNISLTPIQGQFVLSPVSLA